MRILSLRISVQIPIVRSESDENDATIKINKAVLELFRHGGGPAHINLASAYNNNFVEVDLSSVRVFKRFVYGQELPRIKQNARVAIVVGSHKQFSKDLTNLIDEFCEQYNGVVLVDHSSHYWGRYRILPTIITCQEMHSSELFNIDLLIHIGEEHGDYYTDGSLHRAKEVWRVSEDGEIRDTYGKLTNTFEMSEEQFFASYVGNKEKAKVKKRSYRDAFEKETKQIYSLIPELPFSNIWVAQHMIKVIDPSVCLELGASNTMRSWTFFDFNQETYVLANTGCRGIDGAIPTLLGMSLAHPEKLHYAVMGDLTFFYSFNVLCNRHIGNNIRIVLINNGCGYEFNSYPHRAYQIYHGDHEKIDEFIAAGGHTGSKSKLLVKHYAEDLGMKYFSASSKAEFLKILPEFMDSKMEQPMVFEVFTDCDDEDRALKMMRTLKVDSSRAIKRKIKDLVGRVL